MIKELEHHWEKKSKNKKKLKQGKHDQYGWNYIERLNAGLGITRKTCYIDQKGYLRWKSN